MEPVVPGTSGQTPSSSHKHVHSSSKILLSAKNINKLPNEMLLKIMSHFSAEELCSTISDVCVRWNALYRDTFLWRSLCFSCDHTTKMSIIYQVLSDAPVLFELKIHNRHDASQLVAALFGSCQRLRRLNMNFCHLGENSADLLDKVVQFFPDLEVLILEGCQPLDKEGYMIISRLQKLTTLNLTHCKGLDSHSLARIVDGCELLEELFIDDVVQIYDPDIVHAIQRHHSKLKVLVLDGEDLTDKSFIQVAKCSRLRVLKISFCDQMTDVGLLEGVGQLQYLQNLQLRRGNLLSAGPLHIPEPLQCLQPGTPRLIRVLSANDEGLLGIAKRCQQLVLLSLHWCWDVTDLGLMRIVTHCKKLRALDLLGVVRITGKTALTRLYQHSESYFKLIPSNLTKLTYLNLEQCNNICDEAVLDLVTAKPDLIVINYYGDPVMKESLEESARSSDVDEFLGTEG